MKRVLVNPGHCYYTGNLLGESPDPGAINTTYITGKETLEEPINVQLANSLVSKLQERGINAELYQSNNISDIINHQDSEDIFVSIHLNSSNDKTATGTETFYKSNSELSKQLAESVQKGLTDTLKLNDRGVTDASTYSNIGVVNNANTEQAILVETAFISNDSDLDTVLNNQDNVTDSLANSIASYISKTNSEGAYSTPNSSTSNSSSSGSSILDSLNSNSKVTTSSSNTVNTASKIQQQAAEKAKAASTATESTSSEATIASASGTASNSNKKTSSETGDNDTTIIKFAEFIATTFFKQQFTHAFSQNGYSSLWDILSRFVSFFFYNIYTIPNLIDNKALVVKPETLFGFAPLCNLIVPSFKTSITYSRGYKTEPTRLFLKTSPISITGMTGQTPIASIAVVDNVPETYRTVTDKLDETKETSTITKIVETITNINSQSNIEKVKDLPMFKASNFEKKYGIRISPTYGGDEILSFLFSKKDASSDKGNVFDKNSSIVELKQLARYLLAKQRYQNRSGSISMFFNPYIVPGFPFISLENRSLTPNALTIYGYITNVVHNITYNSWTTSASYIAGHTDSEAVPEVFPIIEDDYDPSKGSTGASNLYKKILGKTTIAVDPTKANSQYGYLTNRQATVMDAYNVIHRYATSLENYLNLVAPGAKAIENGTYMKITHDNYYRADVQALVESFTTKCISNNRSAFSVNDIR